MAKNKIICDGVNRKCFKCHDTFPIECFHLRSNKKDEVKRVGKCKFCVNAALTERNQFLTAFHRNAKLVLGEEIYEQIKQMQK